MQFHQCCLCSILFFFNKPCMSRLLKRETEPLLRMLPFESAFEMRRQPTNMSAALPTPWLSGCVLMICWGVVVVVDSAAVVLLPRNGWYCSVVFDVRLVVVCLYCSFVPCNALLHGAWDERFLEWPLNPFWIFFKVQIELTVWNVSSKAQMHLVFLDVANAFV